MDLENQILKLVRVSENNTNNINHLTEAVKRLSDSESRCKRRHEAFFNEKIITAILKIAFPSGIVSAAIALGFRYLIFGG